MGARMMLHVPCCLKSSTPNGIRTRANAVRGRHLRPLDHGGKMLAAGRSRPVRYPADCRGIKPDTRLVPRAHNRCPSRPTPLNKRVTDAYPPALVGCLPTKTGQRALDRI